MINYNQIFIALISLIVIFFSTSEGITLAEQKKLAKEAITITSQTLVADNKAKTAIFEGSVKAIKGDIVLYADKMTVYYQEEKAAGSIKKIDAEGNIKLIKGDRVVTSSFAQYLTEGDEKVIFTGEPMATDGQSVITGSKMTYFFKNDRYLVENSRVLMQQDAPKKNYKKGDR